MRDLFSASFLFIYVIICAQFTALDDYSDGVDAIEFLLDLQ